VAVGITLLGFAIKRVIFVAATTIVLLVLFLVCFLTLVFFTRQVSTFLIGRTYKYIWTLNETLAYRDDLERFSAKFPDTPKASETFANNLLKDIAFCTSRNVKINDERSENLYWANVNAFIFVLSALIITSTAVLIKVVITNG
jgi:hypothetical protein